MQACYNELGGMAALATEDSVFEDQLLALRYLDAWLTLRLRDHTLDDADLEQLQHRVRCHFKISSITHICCATDAAARQAE